MAETVASLTTRVEEFPGARRAVQSAGESAGDSQQSAGGHRRANRQAWISEQWTVGRSEVVR